MKKILIASIVLILGLSNVLISVQAAGHTHTDSCYTTTEGHKHTGSANTGGGCYTTPVYHTHTGNESTGGGCYTEPVYHKHTGSANTGGGCYTIPVTCDGNIIASTENKGSYTVGPGSKEYAVDSCPFCGQTHGYCTQCGIGYSCSGFRCGGHPLIVTTYKCDKCGTAYSATGTCTKVISYKAACGYDEKTPIKYNLACEKTEKSVEYYELSCGQAESEPTRTLTCTIPESSGVEIPTPSETPKPTDAPKTSEPPKTVETPTPSETPTTTKEAKPVETPKPTETPKPSETPETPTVVKKPIENKEAVSEIVEISTAEVPKSAFPQTVATVGAATGTGGVVFFAIFWMFKRCSIFSFGEFVGKVRIRRKKGRYLIKIPNDLAERAEGELSVVFPKKFVKTNLGQPVQIIIKEHVFEESIQDEIMINEEWRNDDGDK